MVTIPGQRSIALTVETRFPGDLEANLQRFDELGLATAITESTSGGAGR